MARIYRWCGCWCFCGAGAGAFAVRVCWCTHLSLVRVLVLVLVLLRVLVLVLLRVLVLVHNGCWPVDSDRFRRAAWENHFALNPSYESTFGRSDGWTCDVSAALSG